MKPPGKWVQALPDMLEIYRNFRMNFFKDINDFYKEYFEVLDKDLVLFFKKQIKNDLFFHVRKRS